MNDLTPQQPAELKPSNRFDLTAWENQPMREPGSIAEYRERKRQLPDTRRAKDQRPTSFLLRGSFELRFNCPRVDFQADFLVYFVVFGVLAIFWNVVLFN